MRLTGLWWWIDRWRKSTAYTDMTLEEQGAYRNLLDEATLRGGPIPDDDRILAKACGDAKIWRRVRSVVLKRFRKTPEGWRNETLDTVLQESIRRAEAQRAFRARSGNPVARNPEEHRARDRARAAVNRALKKGTLMPSPCERCGAVPAEAHHDDYQHPLSVRWLCHTHHAEYHNVIRPHNVQANSPHNVR